MVPAKNEEGRLNSLIQEILTIKEINQIIIVEGGSNDKTKEIGLSLAKTYTNKIVYLEQTGKGKFNAVLNGADCAKNKFIIVWDADGTVPLSDTKTLIKLALEKKCIVFGNRLKGEIEKGAMQKANYIANWGFALIWSPFTDWKPIDLLCGTKIFPKKIINNIPNKILKTDPYGDFSILTGAVISKEKVLSIKVNYKKRTYGKTNIKRWSGGIQLLRTTFYFYLNYFKLQK